MSRIPPFLILVLSGACSTGTYSLGSDPQALSDAGADVGADARSDAQADAGPACGVGLPPCAAGSYCDFPDDACGGMAASGTTRGVCRTSSTGCDGTCVTVCGCDGVEYCNPCVAERAGVDVAPAAWCAVSGTRCGAWLGKDCGPDEFCDFAAIDCGATDPGRCLVRPKQEDCPTSPCGPICGCDGVQYCGECDSHVAGYDRMLACP